MHLLAKRSRTSRTIALGRGMEGKGSEFLEKNKKLGLENRIRIGYNIIRGS